MKYFLIVYSRPNGELVELTEFDSGDVAMQARFEREDQHAGDANIEVVVLGASSLDQVKRTHGRYFKTLTELLEL